MTSPRCFPLSRIDGCPNTGRSDSVPTVSRMRLSHHNRDADGTRFEPPTKAEWKVLKKQGLDGVATEAFSWSL